MTKPIECEYRVSQEGIAEAIRKKGISRGTKECARPGENIDHVCDFIDVTDSSQCPYIRLQKGEIGHEEFQELMFGS